MYKSVEETATDPRNSLFRYLAALTKLRFDPLSKKLSPPDSYHKISLIYKAKTLYSKNSPKQLYCIRKLN